MREYRELLDQISAEYTATLGANLVGIYVHGSIALGGFNWERSDIDWIVVLDRPLDPASKLALLGTLGRLRHLAPAKGFEMSVVLRRYCEAFEYPTPYELHFSDAWLDSYRKDPLSLCAEGLRVDKDLAAHFTVIRQAGIAWCGEPVERVFGPVPPAAYLDSILNDIRDADSQIETHFTYTVLNCCRVLALVEQGQVLSKEQGGNWALKRLPTRFLPVVKAALDDYHSIQTAIPPVSDLQEFCDVMLKWIHAPQGE